jgi:hypothetical protein
MNTRKLAALRRRLKAQGISLGRELEPDGLYTVFQVTFCGLPLIALAVAPVLTALAGYAAGWLRGYARGMWRASEIVGERHIRRGCKCGRGCGK